MNEKPLIYVAGPISLGNTLPPEAIEDNIQKAVDVGIQLFRLGCSPFVPHLYYRLDRRARETGALIGYEQYMNLDFAVLRNCDALFYLGSSPGADRELALARKLGLPVFDSLGPILAWQTQRVRSYFETDVLPPAISARLDGARFMMAAVRRSLTQKVAYYKKHGGSGSAYQIAALEGFLNETVMELRDAEAEIKAKEEA